MNDAAIYTGLGYAIEVWVKLWSVIVLFTQTMATKVCYDSLEPIQYRVSLKPKVVKHATNTDHENPT